MTAQRSFPRVPQAVAAARRFALQALAGAAADARQAVELMVSELATNAIRHTGGPFAVSIAQEGDEVRVEVSDHAGGRPQMRSPAPHEPNGRGLQIVNMLSTDWGVEAEGTAGKTVWFTLTVPAARL